jgi:hypothetical protein
MGQKFTTFTGSFHEPERIEKTVKDRPITGFSRNDSEARFKKTNRS